MIRAIQRAAACVAVLVATAGQVQAAIITYTDRTTWEVAVGSFATENFDSESLFNFGLGANIVGPFDFNIAGTQAFGGVRVGTDFDNVDGTTFVKGGDNPDVSMTMAFSSPVTAFFADFANVNGSDGLNIVVDSTPFNLPTFFSGGQDGSFGVVSSTPFSFIEFDSGDEAFGIDNISTPAAVPEPSALALFGIGACIAGFGAARRRRREKHEDATA